MKIRSVGAGIIPGGQAETVGRREMAKLTVVFYNFFFAILINRA
jgi:hypothetical protein